MKINYFKDRFSGIISANGKKHSTPINLEGHFTIPVIDVRDGAAARSNALFLIEGANSAAGSRYFLDGNRLKVKRVSRERV